MEANAMPEVLCVGETLVDFIGEPRGGGLSDVTRFHPHLGGSPANIALNVAKLGHRSAVVSRIGGGTIGAFVRRELRRHGVMTDYVVTDGEAPTTAVFVTRSIGTPEFVVERGADARLSVSDIDVAAVAAARFVHVSTFGLSVEPSRSALIHSVATAHGLGVTTTYDPNYSDQMWPDRAEALGVIAGLLEHVDLVKPSLDDSRRLFGDTMAAERYIERFHDMGARTVILTMGGDGVLVSGPGVREHVHPTPVEVVDVTGAGDAFWAGFLVARLEEAGLVDSVRFGSAVAAIKLRTVGPVEGSIDVAGVWESLS